MPKLRPFSQYLVSVYAPNVESDADIERLAENLADSTLVDKLKFVAQQIQADLNANGWPDLAIIVT